MFEATEDLATYAGRQNMYQRESKYGFPRENGDEFWEQTEDESSKANDEIISSLIRNPNTPFDLIQADFPSTPSTVFPSNIAGTLAGLDANNAPATAQPNRSADIVDSMKQLYVEPAVAAAASSDSGKVTTAPPAAPVVPATIPVQVPVHSAMHYYTPEGVLVSTAPGQPPVPAAVSAGAVAATTAAPPAAPHGAPAASPAAYYVPQTVYVDPSGAQQIYYRYPTAAGAHYPPGEVVYAASSNPDGTPGEAIPVNYVSMANGAGYWTQEQGHPPMYAPHDMYRRMYPPAQYPYMVNPGAAGAGKPGAYVMPLPGQRPEEVYAANGQVMARTSATPEQGEYIAPGYGEYRPDLVRPAGEGSNTRYGGMIPGHPVSIPMIPTQPGHGAPYGIPAPGAYPGPHMAGAHPIMATGVPPQYGYGQPIPGTGHYGHPSTYRQDDDRYREYHRGDKERNSNHRERGHGGNGANNGSKKGSNVAAAGSNPVRDPLVDEFRNTIGKSRQWGLRDLMGHVVAFCQDQHGSRFIQQKLEVCSDSEKQFIFTEIIPAAGILMTDVFGNYVLQKLFEFGSSEQCDKLSDLLIGQSVILSMQMYGCRVVQKALEYVSTNRLVTLVEEFEDPSTLLNCVHDANGNHVIQKCIEIVSKAARESSDAETSSYLNGRIQFIIDAFRGNVKELSSHPYGCRVVQRILEHCSNPQKAAILEELRLCYSDLVQDCYGNYVIQFVMQHGWEVDRAVLMKEVQTNLLEFSQHKFASNVVEKCLQFANKKDRDEMIWKIINVVTEQVPATNINMNNGENGRSQSVLEAMVRDPYANYVVQKVIDMSDDKQRAAILKYVKDNISQLRRYTYGKHIILRLEKITNEKF